MYPITHAWFDEYLWGDPSELMILGAVFPDTAICSGLDRDLMHKPGLDLLRELGALGPAEHDFALGWLSHVADPHGLDFFGDNEFPGAVRGYCFELAVPYIERAARICGLAADLGWWKAHNFVEMGIELLAVEAWPDAARRCRAAMAGAEKHAGTLEAVATLLGVERQRIMEGYRAFPSFIQLDEVTPMGLASCYEIQVRARHGVDHIDRVDAARLIAECSQLAQRSLDGFMRFAAEQVLEISARIGGPRGGIVPSSERG